MTMKPGSLDQWRTYFRSANSDIFDIINHAIMVAASDVPKEFKLRRDSIAERLFSTKLTRCLGCDKVELAVPGDAAEEHCDDDDGGCKSGNNRDGVVVSQAGASKESKVNSSGNDHGEIDVNRVVSNYSFGEAEALTDEIDEQSQFFGEVLRIKEVLQNHEEESDSVLFESLRRLQLMELTVDCLKSTEIGKAVNPLRKHGSNEVRQLARTLIGGWKEMVDEWYKATTTTTVAASEGTPDSVNPSVLDEEEGLPSPPMDEGAFFVAQPGSIELSQFFDGMDDFGNPRQSGQLNKNCENGRKSSVDSQSTEKRKLSQAPNETKITVKDDKYQLVKKNDGAVRLNKPVAAAASGPGRPPKSTVLRKNNAEPKMQPKQDNATITNKPPNSQQDKFKCSDDDAKLEAAKRKLQERYQQVENAKRQRTIQVMELNDLPKHGVGHRNPHFKPGFNNRNWANARR